MTDNAKRCERCGLTVVWHRVSKVGVVRCNIRQRGQAWWEFAEPWRTYSAITDHGFYSHIRLPKSPTFTREEGHAAYALTHSYLEAP